MRNAVHGNAYFRPSSSTFMLNPIEFLGAVNHPQWLRNPSVFRRQTAGVAPVMRQTHRVMWAWSAKPVSAAILHKESEVRVIRSQAERARSSARNTDGVAPYAVANPLQTVSRARPFTSAQVPISRQACLVRSHSRRSGQSFL